MYGHLISYDGNGSNEHLLYSISLIKDKQMKKPLFIFLMAIATCNCGYSNDSLKIVTLQREVSILSASVSRLRQESGKIYSL